jgi:sulfate transport system substrate-binding protein
MAGKAWLGLGGLVLSLWLGLLGWGWGSNSHDVELLNVSYDPTRELWREVNARFVEHFEEETGVKLAIYQSHGGSSGQARAVMEGTDADVVTLAVPTDTDALRNKGLIAEGWEKRLPNDSLAFTSTIVFVVRKGNPKEIKDWPDLIREGVAVITPNPKTSGNGKMSFLAAWGAAATGKGGGEEWALDYVTRLYERVPVLDSGARGSTTTFAQKHIGDVHLTWENEAYFEIQESKGKLELAYPSRSIRAEPKVAVVDANVDRKGTRHAAEKYLRFLYTDEGQEIIARHHYRPINPEILKAHENDLPPIELFDVTAFVKDWDEAQKKFFAEGGVFDTIYLSKSR